MDKKMQKTIMAVGGHVGDAELTCGGVLASLALKGYRVVTVALTAGERGNPPHMTVAEYREQKVNEAEAFAKILGGESVVLPYCDGELPDNDTVRFEVCDLIRKYRPCALLTHWKNSMHKDHCACHRIVKDAQFYAGLASIEREAPAHYAAGPYYAQNWEDETGFHPYVYVEVSEEGFKLWEKAIETSWFANNSNSFAYREYYSALMRANGLLVRKAYAEAFDIEEHQKKIIKTEF